MARRDYSVLLDPVIAAIDALIAVTRSDPATVKDAREFLEFKFYAAVHTADQIRAQLPAAASSLAREGNELVVTFDHAARFALFVLVDTFLFEAGSVRDAVAQLANAAFALGLATDDTRLTDKVRQSLNPDGTKNTGLEAWFGETTPWLNQLLWLRNTTTHRQVVRLPVRLRWADGGVSWTSHIAVESRKGDPGPLLEFINRTETGLSGLLVESLKRLAEVKPSVR